MPSNLSLSKYPKQMYFIVLLLVLLLCVGWRRENRAHLDRRPTGVGSLACPCECLVQISSFQHPKTAYVLLRLCVRPVGDEHLTVRLSPQRPRVAGRGETGDKLPHTGSHHLFVEHVDLAVHGFVFCDGWVVIVGMVDSN